MTNTWTRCGAVERLEHEPNAEELEKMKRKVAAELAEAILCGAFIIKSTPDWAPCPKEWTVAAIIQVRDYKTPPHLMCAKEKDSMKAGRDPLEGTELL